MKSAHYVIYSEMCFCHFSVANSIECGRIGTTYGRSGTCSAGNVYVRAPSLSLRVLPWCFPLVSRLFALVSNRRPVITPHDYHALQVRGSRV